MSTEDGNIIIDEMEAPDAVKISLCNTCGGAVRRAVNKYLKESLKVRNEFMREVMKFNLSVREMPLSDCNKIDNCSCKH